MDGGAVLDCCVEGICFADVGGVGLTPSGEVLSRKPEADGFLSLFSDFHEVSGGVELVCPVRDAEGLILDRIDPSRPICFEVAVDVADI